MHMQVAIKHTRVECGQTWAWDNAVSEAEIASELSHDNIIATYHWHPVMPGMEGHSSSTVRFPLPTSACSSSSSVAAPVRDSASVLHKTTCSAVTVAAGCKSAAAAAAAATPRQWQLYLVQELCSADISYLLNRHTLHNGRHGSLKLQACLQVGPKTPNPENPIGRPARIPGAAGLPTGGP